MHKWAKLLAEGKVKEFYLEFERRFAVFPQLKDLRDSFPADRLWLKGQDISDKHIVLLFEQGTGDNVQFLRYLPFLKCKRLTVFAYASVAPLVECMDCVDGICLRRWPKDFDYFAHLLSLPYLLDLDTIPTDPYVKAMGQGIKLDDNGFKVGFTNVGNAEYVGDKWRSMPLAQWGPLITIPGIEWWCFVPDKRPRVYKGSDEVFGLMAHPDDWAIKDCGSFLTDWYQTALWVQAMDVIVSVDTALLHLAGAMGKPAIGLLPFDCDWRWSAQWYPSVTLFKQKTKDDWTDPIAEAADLVTRYSTRIPLL